MPAQRIGEIVAGRRAVTADTDLRLCKFFGLCNGYRLRALATYDTEVTEPVLARTPAKIKPWTQAQTKGGYSCVGPGACPHVCRWHLTPGFVLFKLSFKHCVFRSVS